MPSGSIKVCICAWVFVNLFIFNTLGVFGDSVCLRARADTHTHTHTHTHPPTVHDSAVNSSEVKQSDSRVVSSDRATVELCL